MASQATNRTLHAADGHGWISTGTVKTRAGDFEFKNSYPAADAVEQLKNTLVFNRAVETFLVQMHGVSCITSGKAFPKRVQVRPIKSSSGRLSWMRRRYC